MGMKPLPEFQGF